MDEQPEAVVEAFIDRMKSVHGAPEHGRAALELINAEGRENLAERARRAAAVSGRPVSPEEILVPSRFSVAFEPTRYSAEIKGNHARVTLTGANPSVELAEIRCVREEGRWRVVVDLPKLPPIEKREQHL